jgi:hypothetical protein
VTRQVDELARHVRRLGNHELNELLLQLPKPSFAGLVEVALARPVLPAGCCCGSNRPGGWMAGRWWPVRRAGGWAP